VIGREDNEFRLQLVEESDEHRSGIEVDRKSLLSARQIFEIRSNKPKIECGKRTFAFS
jgi:hypothetical protein